MSDATLQLLSTLAGTFSLKRNPPLVTYLKAEEKFSLSCSFWRPVLDRSKDKMLVTVPPGSAT